MHVAEVGVVITIETSLASPGLSTATSLVLRLRSPSGVLSTLTFTVPGSGTTTSFTTTATSFTEAGPYKIQLVATFSSYTLYSPVVTLTVAGNVTT